MKAALPFASLLLVAACTNTHAPAASAPVIAATATPATAAVPATNQTAIPTATQTATPDTHTSLNGNSYVVPAEWSVKVDGPLVIVSAPEGDSRIVLIDLPADITSADAAVTRAWALYRPNGQPAFVRAIDRPARNGWQAIRSYKYVADEGHSLGAQALRRGEQWAVMIFDLSDAVESKRGAQVNLTANRFRPKGYQPETFAGKTAHQLNAERLKLLRDYVEYARPQFDVPGVGIGIVQDGKVVMAEGFGVRELGKPDKVDANTLFMIASNAKPLTTLMLAKQVDAGRFTWDTPAITVMPSFQLGNAETTRQVLMKHLVCACTGLPRQDLEWMFNSDGGTPASVLATLATMTPTAKFGELYQYSNSLAAAGGYIGGYARYPDRELGAAYDATMQELVLDPLGMSNTTFDYARALRGHPAMPHSEDASGKTVPASFALQYTGVPSRPEGGAWSTVNDMLRYLQMELRNGLLPDGSRYISETALLARREQQVSRGDKLGYGIGVKIDRNSGITTLTHGGNMFGYISDVIWLPEHNVGAVILTNADSGGIYLRSLFRRRLLEVLFDGEPEAVANVPIQQARMKDDLISASRGLTVPASAAAAKRLATRYHSTELGDIQIKQSAGKTWFDTGAWQSEVASRTDANGTVTFVTVAPGLVGWLEFVLEENGQQLRLPDEQHEYRFNAVK